MLEGKKTYIVGLGLIIYGIGLFLTDQRDQGISRILEGLGFMALRAGVTKSGQ